MKLIKWQQPVTKKSLLGIFFFSFPKSSNGVIGKDLFLNIKHSWRNVKFSSVTKTAKLTYRLKKSSKTGAQTAWNHWTFVKEFHFSRIMLWEPAKNLLLAWLQYPTQYQKEHWSSVQIFRFTVAPYQLIIKLKVQSAKLLPTYPLTETM